MSFIFFITQGGDMILGIYLHNVRLWGDFWWKCGVCRLIFRVVMVFWLIGWRFR